MSSELPRWSLMPASLAVLGHSHLIDVSHCYFCTAAGWSVSAGWLAFLRSKKPWRHHVILWLLPAQGPATALMAEPSAKGTARTCAETRTIAGDATTNALHSVHARTAFVFLRPTLASLCRGTSLPMLTSTWFRHAAQRFTITECRLAMGAWTSMTPR
jgi:hypothetical protein